MDFENVKQTLAAHPDKNVLFRFQSGQSLAEHFHVTEVGRVTKDFVDCGGTRRTVESCVLQTLVADDVDHRLTAGKLLSILDKSSVLGIDANSTVDLEVQQDTVSVFSVASTVDDDTDSAAIVFQLAPKQTECLAPDKCGIESLTVLGGDCSEPGCC